MHSNSQICVVGLAVMGQNLALNIARNGFAVTAWDRSEAALQATLDRCADDFQMVGAKTPAEACASLSRPRKLLLLIKAGEPVDITIAQFLPHLDPGDMIVDAGNSHPDDTERRARELASHEVRFVGMGVSGGEEGALNGPSLMPGGDADAFQELAPILQQIAARVEDEPCVTHVGAGAAGHFVKMVHNGIEYGDMQLIAECFDLMKHVLGMDHAQMAATFAEWNDGVLESFLVEITAQILGSQDAETGSPMVEVILDKAGQKGTGRWTSEIALRYGVPVPTMQAAVEARYLSAMKAQRLHASESLSGPPSAPVATDGLLDALRDALYCSKICSYAQGLDLITKANNDKRWGVDLGEVARIWRGGCIIRARFLQSIQAAYRAEQSLPNLLLDPQLGGFLQAHQTGWRRVVALAAERGVPVLAMAASLSYFDSYRRASLPQNLTQAQRDLFGAHTFERTDKPAGEWFHHDWE
ncbi:MAG: phosphogluconate dehydrogenase (NADP(+)-dependent, decarboxylating) [Planctomycetes bacterium]|nr:phosphogluconate dehydrogenase (NADP(+)-dependent, decarboxylating) [Planctomycetota bacterium]